MNIGIITQWFDSGAGYVAKSYENSLRKNNNVYIYARGGKVTPNDSFWNMPNVYWAKPHSCSTGIYRNEFLRWVKSNNIEVVLFNEQRYWDAVVYSRKLGLLTGAYVDYYTSKTVPFFDLYDFLICNTKRHYSVFKDHPQACYCPWGTDTEIFRPMNKGMPKNRPLTFLISAGWDGAYARRNNPSMDRRGTGIVLRALAKVRGNWKLVIHSQVPLEGCPENWKTNIRNNPRIDFRVGTIKPPGLFHLGDIYLYPSRLDGIGLTLPEALSCGLAGVTTDNPPMNEFVRDGKTGSLIKVKEFLGRFDGYYWAESICDEDSLSAIIAKYIKSPDLAFQHGQAARQYAVENLCWEKNSAFLSDWLFGLNILEDRPGSDLKKLFSRAVKYDRIYNPKPWQQILWGFYRYLSLLRQLSK